MANKESQSPPQSTNTVNTPFLSRKTDGSADRHSEMHADMHHFGYTVEKQPAESPIFMVRKPGLLTTIQDGGRVGYKSFGVPASGAADKLAWQTGNALLGNSDGCAALEMTLLGPELEVLRTTRIAVTGADLGLKVGGRSIPPWSAFTIHTGDVLQLTGTAPPNQQAQQHVGGEEPQTAATVGCRAYLCVQGGLHGDAVLGSSSTDVTLGVGGLAGRALRAGDLLYANAGSSLNHLYETPPHPLRRVQTLCRDTVSYMNAPVTVRILEGPQRHHFTDTAWDTLLHSEYRATSNSNRVGVRLEGPMLKHNELGADILSEPIPEGAIQVPASGEPIVLLADHRTVGGYAKIATAVSVDIPKLAQLRSGDAVRFQAISVREAQALLLEQHQWLQMIRILWRG
ncbi:biotin-dependent carboxyltransferase family protein [Alicyclobacillus sp. SO9]|uniref:5-oxoprolinase subunit C family protein n=1 Tax=Alicyclobacillus sp. SO9 TaxID=2665646 RepID=UPI0018E893F2|nr:biotin-dependent carboxyltransferase family protein [Alicyclobacillus sp. SO9]QQE78725.1 biotin-dependent carboxyltransferase family protein [Alicyclobacillus sp. SO9]